MLERGGKMGELFVFNVCVESATIPYERVNSIHLLIKGTSRHV